MYKSEKLLLKIKESGEKIIDEDGFEYFCLKNPEEFFNWAVLSGYILHGTTRKVKILKPQKAQDFVKESGNRIAVYLTENPVRAMFSALTGGITFKDGKESSTQMNINNGVITYSQIDLKVGELQKIASEGYVYIFDKNQSDEFISGEYLAYKPVTPLIVIKIKKADFKYPIKEKVKE